MSTAPIPIPHSAKTFAVSERKSRPNLSAPRTHTRNASTEEPAKIVADPQRLQEVIAKVNQIVKKIEHLAAQRQHETEELRSLAIQVGIRAAETLLEQEFSAGQHAFTQLITDAIADHKSSAVVRVTLHPQDLELVNAANPHLDTVGDPAVERGNCRIEFDEFVMERDWRDQLARIKDALMLESS